MLYSHVENRCGNFNGEKEVWNDSLSESLTYLPAFAFYPVKRSIIVNRTAILEMIIVGPKKTIITLVAPINLKIQVSQRENAGFKKWFANKHNFLKAHT